MHGFQAHPMGGPYFPSPWPAGWKGLQGPAGGQSFRMEKTWSLKDQVEGHTSKNICIRICCEQESTLSCVNPIAFRFTC